jgi:hypothetical protein
MVSFFQPWGPIQGHKFQHLLITWGKLNFFFSISALIPSVKALGASLFKYYWPFIIIIHTSTFLVMVVKKIMRRADLQVFS